MKYQYIDETLYVYFYGDFDNLTVSQIKPICIALIEKYKPRVVKLDFEEVSFIDSTGIGFVLARYKQLEKMDARLVLCNLSKSNQTLFQMSGVFQLMKQDRNGVKL